jgi:voltage-gated potassium channel
MASNIKKTLKQLDSIKLEKLELDEVTTLLESIKCEYSQIDLDTTELINQSKSMLADGDIDVLSFARTHKGRMETRLDSLKELELKLQNERQRKIIKERMIERLGSRGRLIVLEAVIMSLIAVVLGLLVYDVFIAGPDATRPAWLSQNSIFLMDTICCVIFMSEFVFRLWCAESKRYVWKHHWVDFLTSIPIPGEAQLARFGRFARFARFTRAIRFLRFLRFLRVFLLVWRGMDKLQHVIDVKLMKKTLRWSIMIMLLGAFLVYQFEGIPVVDAAGNTVEGNPVGSYPLALWWSFTTVVTGGFGDIHNPSSISGQMLTAVLVITGMIFVGVFTATLTSLFVGEQAEELEKLDEKITEQFETLSNRFDQLVDDQREDSGST